MASRSIIAVFLSLVAIGFLFYSTFDDIKNDRPLTELTDLQLVFETVLLDGTKKMHTAFADVNGDAKPDLILGSKGHQYSSVSPTIRNNENYGAERTDLSIHLNRSIGGSVAFATPYWPKDRVDHAVLPGG